MRRLETVTQRPRKVALIASALVIVALAIAAWFFFSNDRQKTVVTGKDGAPSVLVPAATFTMGDGEESPLRTVYVDAFYLDRFEVTTARFAKFLEATGAVSEPEGWDEAKSAASRELPVVGVDWREADAYCRWAGKRLPTEAEWERAARGTDARVFPWGNDAPSAARARFAPAHQARTRAVWHRWEATPRAEQRRDPGSRRERQRVGGRLVLAKLRERRRAKPQRPRERAGPGHSRRRVAGAGRAAQVGEAILCRAGQPCRRSRLSLRTRRGEVTPVRDVLKFET